MISEETQTTEDIEVPSLEWLRANFKTKAAAIRYLGGHLGLDKTFVAHYLDVKYQMVYNVLERMERDKANLHRCPVCKGTI